MDQLFLSNLRLDVDLETAVDVYLRRLHTKKPAFVRAHDLALIGNRDLCADHQRKLLADQFSRDARKGRVRHFLHADPGVEEPADFQVVILFVLDVYIRDLSPRALVREALFIRPQIARKRIQRPLDFEEHLLMGHPAWLHTRRFERGLDSGHQTLKLRQTIFMLTQSSLNALARREAPLVGFLARLSPLKVRAVVVNVGVPDEIHVQPPLQVMSLPLPGIPQTQAFPIERLKHWVLDSLFSDVAIRQVAVAIRDFISNLHSHRSLRQRSN